MSAVPRPKPPSITFPTGRRHPISTVVRDAVALHPDAPPIGDRAASGPRCGGCVFRAIHVLNQRGYPKCEFGNGRRVTAGPSSDVRAWWPACRDYVPAEPD